MQGTDLAALVMAKTGRYNCMHWAYSRPCSISICLLIRSTLLGSVLRIDVDKKDPGKEYAVPPTNPFVGYSNVHSEIWAYGLRNPWRCSIDRGDRQTGEGAGRVFCGDVGQEKYEEIDIIEGGRNYEWRAFEGNSCFDENQCSTCTFCM